MWWGEHSHSPSIRNSLTPAEAEMTEHRALMSSSPSSCPATCHRATTSPRWAGAHRTLHPAGPPTLTPQHYRHRAAWAFPRGRGHITGSLLSTHFEQLRHGLCHCLRMRFWMPIFPNGPCASGRRGFLPACAWYGSWHAHGFNEVCWVSRGKVSRSGLKMPGNWFSRPQAHGQTSGPLLTH